MWKIPADEVIATYEMLFQILFAVGLLSFTLWIQFQYPQTGLILAAMGVLLLWLAKMVRKKKVKLEGDVVATTN